MRVFSKCEKTLWKDRLFIVALTIVLFAFKRLNFYTLLGMVFGAMFVVNVVSELFSYVFVSLVYKSVRIENIRELKHSNKLYQYIITVDGKEIYSNVYTVPLDSVTMMAYKYRNQYVLKVMKKKNK